MTMRRTPMKRTAFRRKEGPTPRPAREWTGEYNPDRPRAVMARCDGMVRDIPKTKPKRNPALLGMAMGKPCLLAIPLVCTGNTATTVACHSNLSIHGKAGARKADDCYSVWGCSACHAWLDQGPAPADVKALAFTLAHVAQVQEWRKTAGDAAETPRHRRAAQWALDQLATA